MITARRTNRFFSHRPGVVELWLWSLLLVATTYWAELLRNSPAAQAPFDVEIVANSVLNAGAFTVCAWIMVLARARRLVPDHPASLRVIAVALGLAVLCVIPARQVTALALTAMGATLLLRAETTAIGRQAGILLLALAGTWISAALLSPLHVAVAHLDAHVVGWLMDLAGIDVQIDGNLIMNGDLGIEVLIPCTSTAPLAEVVLGFVVITLYLRGDCRRADWPWLLLSLLASIVLTEIRLLLMSLSPDNYEWWHYGSGSTVYGFAALVAAAVFPLLAVIRKTHRGVPNSGAGLPA